MWKAIFSSVTGVSHVEADLPCQDACRVKVLPLGDGEVLCVLCADGAGSASHAERGASLVCDELMGKFESYCLQGGELVSLTREQIIDWLEDVRLVIEEESSRADTTCREFAATVLGALVGEDCAVFFQIGDGAMVIGNNNEYRCVFWPQMGEFANTTNFVTGDTYSTDLAFEIMDSRVDELACFTDGLERLALRFEDQSVHGPFLRPMFEALVKQVDVDGLIEPLRSFLDSERVNERTEDDKTLILATRRDEVETVV